MADYIYLLENRLSPAQQRALSIIRNAVRARDLTLFLTGGAVRDLTGGAAVRDLDITIQGETTELRKDLEAAGAIFTGEFPPAQALFFVFPGGVRVEISAAMSVSYPKPGKPKYELTSISEDLRRRDFTANAMALSLNEGSYGLLMDPLNGVADIENRELRLVSNYGFIEDPARLLRAVRLSSRLGWHMEARTQQRYDNVKEETDFEVLSKFARGYEVEEIFHEEDPQRIMRALDAEGWLKQLAPQLSLGKANDSALAELRDKQGQLQTQGILADSAALSFPLLVAKMPAADIASLKSSFARQGFVQEIETLEDRMRELQTRFSGKEAAQPSAAWRMLYDAEPGLVLAMFYAGKGGAVQARLKTFLTESPMARQRLPYQLMQEMRILPDNPAYHEVLDKVFFELMDNKFQTPEEMKAYLEPYSPPAPPPPLNLRRARAKKEARPSRAKAKKVAATVAEDEEMLGVAEGLMEPGTLTGPDRGTEPSVNEPLEGKVAPLAPGETEPITTPATKKSAVKLAAAKIIPAPAAVIGEAGSPAARKLTGKPAVMPADEADALLPHPLATKEIAEKPSKAVTGSDSASSEGTSSPVSGTSAKATKVASVDKLPSSSPRSGEKGTSVTKPGADKSADTKMEGIVSPAKAPEARKAVAAPRSVDQKHVVVVKAAAVKGKSLPAKAEPVAKKTTASPAKAAKAAASDSATTKGKTSTAAKSTPSKATAKKASVER